MIGASLVNPKKLYLPVLGDLAFIYDMNVVGNRYIGNNRRFLLLNNGRETKFRNYDYPEPAFDDAANHDIAAAGQYGNKSSKLVRYYGEDLDYEYKTVSNKEEFCLHTFPCSESYG